jgi:hypothetical protein
MFVVETHAAVRRFVFSSRGMLARRGAGLPIKSGYNFQNVPLFGAARLRVDQRGLSHCSVLVARKLVSYVRGQGLGRNRAPEQ